MADEERTEGCLPSRPGRAEGERRTGIRLAGYGSGSYSYQDSVGIMEVLHLTLKKKWFDFIASGEKKEESREIKPYWDSRLLGSKR